MKIFISKHSKSIPLAILLLFNCSWIFAQTNLPQKPNIIFILMDDVGVEMTNSYGSQGMVRENGNLAPYITPRIDEFATQGLTFENAYATPSCAPTRAQFLTGRYPFRTNILYPLLGKGHLGAEEITIASLLKEAGYQTGLAGKWNLRFGRREDTQENWDEQKAHIRAHGFDQSFSFLGHTIVYGEASPQENFFPYQANEWSLDFIRKSAANDEPFYLQYSLGLIHTPFVNTPTSLGANNKDDMVLGMYEYSDQLIGKVLDLVNSLGLDSQTVVILGGDNGTARSITSRFRGFDIGGAKLTFLDYGSWVPFMVRWQGVITPDSKYSGLTDFSDIFSTMAELAGVAIPNDRVIDGISFARQLTGETDPHRDFIYSQMHNKGFVKTTGYKLFIDPDESIFELYDVTSPFEERLIKENNETTEEKQARRSLKEYYESILNREITGTLNTTDEPIFTIREKSGGVALLPGQSAPGSSHPWNVTLFGLDGR